MADEEEAIYVDIVPRLDESELTKATDKVEDEFKDAAKEVGDSFKDPLNKASQQFRDFGRKAADDLRSGPIKESLREIAAAADDTKGAVKDLSDTVTAESAKTARGMDAITGAAGKITATALPAVEKLGSAFRDLKPGDATKGVQALTDALGKFGVLGDRTKAASDGIQDVANRVDNAKAEFDAMNKNIADSSAGLAAFGAAGTKAGTSMTAMAGPLAAVVVGAKEIDEFLTAHNWDRFEIPGSAIWSWHQLANGMKNVKDLVNDLRGIQTGGSNLPTNPDGTPRPGTHGTPPTTVGGIPIPGLVPGRDYPKPPPPTQPGIGRGFVNVVPPPPSPPVHGGWGGPSSSGGFTTTPPPAAPPPDLTTPGSAGSAGGGGAGGRTFASGAGGRYGLPKGTNIGAAGGGFPDWVYELAARYNVRAATYPGHQEGAGVNQGIDWYGTPEDLQRFAEALVAAKPPGLEQVIWSNPNTGNVLGLTPGGQTVTQRGGYYRDDWADHTGHVHTRFSRNPLTGDGMGRTAGGGTPVMVTSFGESARGDLQSAGIGPIGTDLASDMGLSEGLPGVAKFFTGMLANMAFAPAIGALSAVRQTGAQAASAGGISGGAGLFGMLGALGGGGGGLSGLGLGGGAGGAGSVIAGPPGPPSSVHALGGMPGAPGPVIGPAGLTTPQPVGRQMGQDVPASSGIGFGGGLVGAAMDMASQAGGIAVSGMAPGAGQAAAMGSQIAIDMMNRTAGYVAQVGGIAAQGVLETLMLSDTALADPTNTLLGRIAIGIAGARPQIPNIAGKMGAQIAGGTQSGPGGQQGDNQLDPNDPNVKTAGAQNRPWVNIENFHNTSGNPSDGKQVGNDLAWRGQQAAASTGAGRGGG